MQAVSGDPRTRGRDPCTQREVELPSNVQDHPTYCRRGWTLEVRLPGAGFPDLGDARSLNLIRSIFRFKLI